MTTALAPSTVHSADGTPINYRTTGAGPGVLVVPGALNDASDYAALATAREHRSISREAPVLETLGRACWLLGRPAEAAHEPV